MAKKKVQRAQKEDVFYAGIQDPIEIRRTLLESSKEMLQLLQRHEKFKEVRKEKHENIVRLKHDIKELKKLITKFKSHLPTTHLRVILHQEREKVDKEKAKLTKSKQKTKGKIKVAKVAKEEVEKPLSKKEMSELEKLEAELSSIENKLGTLV